ncbi:carbohydrate esterase family 8 protein [Dacryopinax primogenitus]|uniref:pectinesterase n=1 Tax=Dacryopinax primogenitus (strain DJM 731) TaxID=1858805 RepID=M5G8M5_DACPD|nr:carbohydrate esterase family 8 protein [Dacryopinax primogenitus]EJU04530.1 carbohydrate esterase family 8 protein [Dacryopinax primogenitus]
MVLGLLLLVLAAVATSSGSWNKYDACQRVKPPGHRQTDGCPEGTIYVSQNDGAAAFTNVQSAVESFPDDLSHSIILIAPGMYKGLVNVTRKGPVTLLGQYVLPTINLVTIWDDQFVTEPPPAQDDAQTAVLIVAPTFNASLIGMGTVGFPLQPEFGNADFKAYHIDFRNLAVRHIIQQRRVLTYCSSIHDISYANASFYGCNFASYQDTWYMGRNASTYVKGGTIYGETDYVFGFGAAYVLSDMWTRGCLRCTFANRGCGGALVAWKGTNQSDPTGTTPIAPGNHYGAYISNSQIIRSPDANTTLDLTGKCYLGRPWNDDATTLILRTYMDDTINATGFIPFSGRPQVILNTTYYAEYGSYGPGGNTSQRASADHVLDSAQAAMFTIPKVFGGWPDWIDYNY